MRGFFQRRCHLTPLECVGWDNIFSLHLHRIINTDGGCRCGNFNPRQPHSTPRCIPACRHNRKNHLAMKFDFTISQNGVTANRGTAIIEARNIPGRQYGNHPRCFPD